MSNKSLWNKKGISLIELLVSLAIFVLLASLVVSQTSFFTPLAVRMQVESLFADCMALQRAALAHHVDYYIDFDLVENSYCWRGTKRQLPHNISFGVLPGIKGPPSTPNKVIRQPITFKNKRIVFHANGTIEPGTIYIVHKKSRTLYALSSAIGHYSFLRIYHYNGGWQQV